MCNSIGGTFLVPVHDIHKLQLAGFLVIRAINKPISAKLDELKRKQ